MSHFPLREILQLATRELDGHFLSLSDEAADELIVQLDRHLQQFSQQQRSAISSCNATSEQQQQ